MILATLAELSESQVLPLEVTYRSYMLETARPGTRFVLPDKDGSPRAIIAKVGQDRYRVNRKGSTHTYETFDADDAATLCLKNMRQVA